MFNLLALILLLLNICSFKSNLLKKSEKRIKTKNIEYGTIKLKDYYQILKIEYDPLAMKQLLSTNFLKFEIKGNIPKKIDGFFSKDTREVLNQYFGDKNIISLQKFEFKKEEVDEFNAYKNEIKFIEITDKNKRKSLH